MLVSAADVLLWSKTRTLSLVILHKRESVVNEI